MSPTVKRAFPPSPKYPTHVRHRPRSSRFGMERRFVFFPVNFKTDSSSKKAQEGDKDGEWNMEPVDGFFKNNSE